MGSQITFVKSESPGKKRKHRIIYDVIDPSKSLLKPRNGPSFAVYSESKFEKLPPIGRFTQEDISRLNAAGKEMCPYARNCQIDRTTLRVYNGSCGLTQTACSEHDATCLEKPLCSRYTTFWDPKNAERIIAQFEK